MSNHRQRLSAKEKVAIQKVSALTRTPQNKIREILHFLLISGAMDLWDGGDSIIIPYIGEIKPDGEVILSGAVLDMIDPDKRTWAHEYLSQKILDKAFTVMGQ